MSSRAWFRVYSDVLSDRKLRRISRTIRWPRSHVIGAWVSLLALANESPTRGTLLLSHNLPVTENDLVLYTGLEPRQATTLLGHFSEQGMITMSAEQVITITHWDDRQFEDADSSATRQQRYPAFACSACSH